jgi:hypothetical protein
MFSSSVFFQGYQASWKHVQKIIMINKLLKDTLFSVLTNIWLVIEHYLALVCAVPKYLSESIVKVFEVQATLTEDIQAPDMIIIQDYLGTITEENEEALGSILSYFLTDGLEWLRCP